MHIGFLSPEYATPDRPDGGLAHYVRKTALALTSRGHRVSVFYADHCRSHWDDLGVNVHGVSVFPLPGRLVRRLTSVSWGQCLVQLTAAYRLAGEARHVHARDPFTIVQAASYQTPGFGMVGDQHPPMVCRVSSLAPLLRNAYGAPTRAGDFVLDRMEKIQIRKSTRSFAPSRQMADAVSARCGCSVSVIRTAPDIGRQPTDPTFYARNYEGLSYLLFFGTLSRIKGADLLADVIPVVCSRHQQLHFVFIGRDDGLPTGQTVVEHILARCQSCADRVHYHPAIPRTRLLPVIEHALAAVLPSRVDNYPNACLDAVGVGTPVIGTYHSSVDEIVSDGRTGFLALNGNSDSIIAAIERLCALPPQDYQDLRRRVRDLAAAMESEDRVGQLIDFYRSVVAGFRGTGDAAATDNDTRLKTG